MISVGNPNSTQPAKSAELAQQIHLYFGLLDVVDTPHARAACSDIISPAERERADRFLRESDRRQFLLAHGLVRAALSAVAPAVDPAGWQFVTDPHGRPFVAGPVGAGLLHFSLSHAEGCVACVISASEAIGVDVEHNGRGAAVREIAGRTFSPEELEALKGLSPQEQTDRLFDYWTLKEAYIKARGLGLRLPLAQISMNIVPGQKVTVAFAPGFGDEPQRWQFTQMKPSPRHMLAVADGSGKALPVIAQSWPFR